MYKIKDSKVITPAYISTARKLTQKKCVNDIGVNLKFLLPIIIDFIIIHFF